MQRGPETILACHQAALDVILDICRLCRRGCQARKEARKPRHPPRLTRRRDYKSYANWRLDARWISPWAAGAGRRGVVYRCWLRFWALGVRGASRGANEDGRGAVESILNGHGQKRSEAGKVGSDTNAMKRIALALALGLPRALCRLGD